MGSICTGYELAVDGHAGWSVNQWLGDELVGGRGRGRLRGLRRGAGDDPTRSRETLQESSGMNLGSGVVKSLLRRLVHTGLLRHATGLVFGGKHAQG